VWGVFDRRDARPVLHGEKPVEYGDLVQRFGFRSPLQASNALVTAERMYGRMLRAVIGEYAEGEEEIEAEIAELRTILAPCHG